jgi:DNA-binding LacI/PurR family transcriptional regulator
VAGGARFPCKSAATEFTHPTRLFTGAAAHLIDGLILSPVGLNAHELRELHPEMPLVLVGEQISGHLADHVAIDNVAAARVATAHLLALGRRRVAVIGCHEQSDSAAARLRYRGYAAALADAGLAVQYSLVEVLPCEALNRKGGAAAMERLLAREQLPDAVLCYNDLCAFGAIRTLLERGYRVPGDVAVVGIDDIEDGRFSTPSLTTISPDKAQIANVALDLLVSRIKGGGSEQPREIEADFTLPSLPSSGETVLPVWLVSSRARLESLGCWSRRGWGRCGMWPAGPRRER